MASDASRLPPPSSSRVTGWASGPISPKPPPSRDTVEGTVDELLTKATADGTISAAEWKDIRTVADQAPHKASADAREILGAWASDAFSIDSATRSGMRSFLRSCGYDVPSAPGQNVPPQQR